MNGTGDDGGSARGPEQGALSALLQALAAAPTATEVEPPSLAPGTVLGRFEIVRELGRGGFGVVHEARDTVLGRSVALKLVRPGRSSVGEAQLAREAEAVAKLSHHNLVALHEVGRSEHGPYLVFELLRGETLQARLERGPMPAAEALRVGVEVARGLAHAHGEGVVHRDLKPSNVFITNRGDLKLLDFGMAHAFGRRRVSGGTPAYMAPEQWDEAPEDERTDVFALGVMLRRMLTGEDPYPEAGGRWSAGAPPPPRLEVPGAPGLGALVARMLEQRPTARPRDGGEVLAALGPMAQALAHGGQASARVTTGSRTHGRSRGLLIRLLAGVSVLAAVLLLGVLALRDGGWLRKGAEAAAAVAVTGSNVAAAGPTAPKGPEFTILVAPFKASDASVEADAKLMDGLVLRALEKFVRRAPTVAVVAASSSPKTEAEAKALGKAAGARLVLWGNLTALRDELVLEPALTATRAWDVDVGPNRAAETYRWKQTESRAVDQRRQDAEKIGRPAAAATAPKLGDKAAAFAILDDLGDRTEITELSRHGILRDMDRGKEAIPVLRAALVLWPNSFELHHAFFWTLGQNDEPDLARSELPVLARLATGGQDLSKAAVAHFEANDRRRAEELAKRAHRILPGDKGVALGYATMLITWGRRDEARPLVLAGARDPLSPFEAIRAARALSALGQMEAALQLCRRLVVDDDISPFNRAGEAWALSYSMATADRELAARGARRNAREAPDMDWVQVQSGQVLLRAGHEDEGIALLRGALALAPDSPRAQVELGRALLQREPDRARELLRKAVRPRYEYLERANVVQALLSAREPGLALGALDGLIDNRPVPPNLTFRCDAQALAGQRVEALATAEAMRSNKAFAEWGPIAAFVCSVQAGDKAGAKAALVAAKPLLKDPWLTRIASHLLGEGSEQELLRLDGSLSDWDAATRRCEANYYAGFARLRPLTGMPDPVAAADRFRASVEWRRYVASVEWIGHCDESAMAEIELYRLEHPVQ